MTELDVRRLWRELQDLARRVDELERAVRELAGIDASEATGSIDLRPARYDAP